MTNPTGQYISVREAAQLLGVSERKIMDLIEERKLTAYRIANQFLRLKRSDILELKNSGKVAVETIQHPYTRRERFRDFFYYYDFYFLCAGIILIRIFVIIQS